MKINNEQIVELLVQHTGRKEEVVEQQLSELINEIRTTAEEGESFEIERFGTFSMEEDELHFEPSEELYTEVNNKYAGMEPIELIGAYEDSESGEEQPGDHQATETDEERAQETVWPEEEDIWGWEETESHLEDVEETGKEMEESQPEAEPGEEQIAETADQTEAQGKAAQDEEPPAEAEQTEDQEQEEEEAPEATEEEPAAEPVSEEEEPDTVVTVEEEGYVEPEPEPEPESEMKPEPALAAKSTEDAKEHEENETEPKPAFSTATKKGGSRRGNQKSMHNSTYTVLVAAAMIIIIAIGSWFLFDLGVFTESGSGNDSEQSQQAAISTPPNQTQDNASGNISEDESSGQARQGDQPPTDDQNQQPATPDSTKTRDNSEPEPQNQVAQNQEEESASSSSVYGLKGALNSDANDGYTIVVYSMQNQQHAKELYNGLKQEGYRTLMVSAIIDSTRYWRVAIGQFPSIDEAESTARELPEPYGNNFFIKRIR